MICPKCGKSNREIKFIEAFCVDCYPYNIRLPEIEIEECKRCGKVKFRGEWQQFNRKKFEDYVVSKCRGDFSSAIYDSKSNTITFKIRKGNEEVSITRTFEPKIKTSICQECSRKAAGYFEAIIQLRGNPYDVKKYQGILTDLLKKETFLSKTDEKKEGVDLYVGDSKAVIRLFSEMGLKALMTKKLMGVRQGKRYYRTTFLLRF
ncbi:MAG: NMD3-related protein [Candidatus Bilamarchaeaceae archaeon]